VVLSTTSGASESLCGASVPEGDREKRKKKTTEKEKERYCVPIGKGRANSNDSPYVEDYARKKGEVGRGLRGEATQIQKGADKNENLRLFAVDSS